MSLRPPTSPTSAPVRDVQDAQRAHYDRIIAAYEAHYDDPTSQRYRRRTFYEPLFAGMDLEGREVLEAMCGSGQATAWLLERGARVTGLDISGAAIEKFRGRFPQCGALRASILESGLPAEQFDGVVVIGGLHHVHPAVGGAVGEIHRVLRPGGWFAFGEPHAGSIADIGRRWWYRHDALFEAGEGAVDLAALKRENAGRFEFELERYVGGIAYLLVYNSMVFRIPLGLKRFYAPPLMALERALGFLHGRRTACFALARWRKRTQGPFSVPRSGPE